MGDVVNFRCAHEDTDHAEPRSRKFCVRWLPHPSTDHQYQQFSHTLLASYRDQIQRDLEGTYKNPSPPSDREVITRILGDT